MTGNSDEDSDDSSSSGGLEYESPPMSDLDDSDDDLFRKTKIREFHMPTGSESGDKGPVTSTNRKPVTKNIAIDKRLKRLEQSKLARIRKKVKLDSLLDDSDDDSDIVLVCDGVEEEKAVQKDTNGRSESTGNNIQMSVQKTKPIEMLSSSDSSPESSPIASKTKAGPVAAMTAASCQFFSSKIPPKVSRPTRAAAATSAAKTEVIECLSSDDECDAKYVSNVTPKPSLNLRPEWMALLTQAKQAKARLEQAQEYHAQDVHVAVQDNAFIPTSQAVTARRMNKPTPNGKPTMVMGKILSLNCRCGYIVVNGTKEAVTKDKHSVMVMVREKEPLSALVEKFCRHHSLPQAMAKITMNFDGCKLEMNKTPACYEMEDEDLVDVSVAVPRRLTAAEQQQVAKQIPKPSLIPPSLGKTMRFSCRIQIKKNVNNTAATKTHGRRLTRQQEQKKHPSKTEMVTKTVTLCENECFSILAKRLCAILGNLPVATTKLVMRYDGYVLDMQKFPKSYEMEDEDMIEVSIEKQEQENVSLPFHQNCSNVGKSITLRLVQQKGIASIATNLTLEPGEPLSKLMKDYKDKHMTNRQPTARPNQRRSRRTKKDSTQLMFLFHGKNLDLTKTPGDYKMASLDQIDVIDATPAATRSRASKSSLRKKIIEV